MTRLLDKYESLKLSAKRNREKVALAAERTAHTGVAIGSAFATGMARSYYGKGTRGEINFPGTEIDADAVVGLFLLGLGMSGYAGRSSDTVLAAGVGVTCAVAAFEGKRIGDQKRAAA